MTKRALTALAFAAALCAPLAAHAHRAWMAPSATVLAGDDAYVGIDAASSNTLFHADHNAMRLDNLLITGPDGAKVEPENMLRARYRSTFDVHLTKPGTYRIANAMQGLMARYKLNGEDKNWRGGAAELAGAIPAGATDVRITENANLVETFVTLGAPTPVRATNAGLELVFDTHPNDLVAGETAKFRFILDGRPAANLKVTIAPGGARYRNAGGEVEATTDASGAFSYAWPSAGMWWLNASVRDLPSQVPNARRNVNYSGVFEVLP